MMTMAPALPTRHDEAWRYADMDAVTALWPVAPATALRVAAGESQFRTIITDEPTAVQDFSIVLEAQAALRIDLLNIGARYHRVALDVTLHEGASFDLNAVQIAGSNATVELITTVRHLEPAATSNQQVRSVLGGHATGNFLGRIEVARGAQKTDATQSVRAMLLDRTASTNAKPELEIFADDVKCAHGCAIGELDAQALFYLASRGLSPAAAKQLLLQAFVAGVFNSAEGEVALTEAALARLGDLL